MFNRIHIKRQTTDITVSSSMRYKSISFLLFLAFVVEINITYVKTKNIDNETYFVKTEYQKQQSDVVTSVLLNTRQIKLAEVSVKHFLTSLTGSPSHSVTLRLSSSNGNSLQNTINKICSIIREEFMKFARSYGLNTSVRRYEQTMWNSTISEDWLSESLLQGSLLLSDLTEVSEEIWFAINHYFNMSLFKNEEIPSKKPTRTIRFFNTIDDATNFTERLFKCLLSIKDNRKRTSAFDLNRAIANLSKGTPTSILKEFKSRLNRNFLYTTPRNDTWDKKMYLLLCHSLVERVSHRVDCIKELRRLDECMLTLRQDSDEIIDDHIPSPRPWLIAIQHLSDCKVHIDVYGNANVRCNFNRRIPRTTVRQMKYIYEKILNRRISKRSSLHRAAYKLGNAFSRSNWGRQSVYDVYQYFMIYQEGRGKLYSLSKSAGRNKITAARYKEVSKSLSLYKNGILKKVMSIIDKFHRSISMFEKFLLKGITFSLKETWQDHIKVLTCIYEWMKKLLELFGYTELDDTEDIDMSISTPPTELISTTIDDEFYDDNNQLKHHIMYHEKRQIKNEIDEAFERLMLSMNRMSRTRNRNDKSILASLANNLLLVAMFMETVSFISTLFYLGEGNQESNSEELRDEWISSERSRRSLYSTGFTEIDEIKNYSMVTEASRDINNIYKEKDKNSVLIEQIDNFYDINSYFKKKEK